MEAWKIALFGIGGYYLYQKFGTAAVAAPATAPATTTPVTPTGPILNAQQAALKNVVAALGVQGPGLLLTAARLTADKPLSVNQWNYYLTQITQTAGPDLTGYLPGVTLTSTYTVAQYWAALTAYANGQLPSMSGLGNRTVRPSAPNSNAARGQGPVRYDSTGWSW